MKKLYILLVALFLVNGAMAQDCLPEGITFTNQAQIDNFQINHPNCNQIWGDVTINGNDIANLNGLSVLNSIGGNLFIGSSSLSNPSLTSLTGLNTLSGIGGNLEITRNKALTSLTGLDNLISIGGSLIIRANQSLTILSGLDNVTSIGGDFYLQYNALTSLTGLDNIEAGSIMDLYIYDNDSLTTCEVNSICEYLVSPNGTIEIHDNATGCNSQQEIETACGVGMEENKLSENHFNIYPNPTHGKITIDSSAKGHLSILNLSGQELITRQITEPRTQIDISTLPGGIYFVKILGDKTIQIGKIIKE